MVDGKIKKKQTSEQKNVRTRKQTDKQACEHNNKKLALVPLTH